MKKIITLAALSVCVCLLPPAAEAKKMKEWCYGNGCLSGGGMADRSGWHECHKGELNVCRQKAAEKPQ
jgi:hypothetical protein